MIYTKKIINRILILSFFLLSYSTVSLADDITVDKFKITTEAKQDKFIFQISAKAEYTIFSLPSPERIVIDLQDGAMNTRINQSLLRNTFVKGIRVAERDDEVLRIVLDLKKNIQYHQAIEKLPNGAMNLVISMPSRNPAPKEETSPANKVKFSLDDTIVNSTGHIVLLQNISKSKNAIKPSEKKIIDSTPISSSVPKPDIPDNLRLRELVIVIDPGHGGKDPGVSSAHGTREKDVVLAVAKDLRYQFNQELGVKAILTRSGDYFLPLKERLRIAHENNADLFISIHADTYKKNSSIKGVSIFALSANGATSENARWLAKKENESELGKSPNRDALRSALIDLAQTTTINSSLAIAKSILLQLPAVAKLHTHRIEQASFVVLKSPNMPSLLIETGFLSDPNEESLLLNPDYDNKLAYAIKQGISDYFLKNPPAGTYLSYMKNNE